MAVTLTELIPAKYAENSQTSQYTAAVGQTVVIDKFTVTNISASPATLSVNIVASGGTAGNDNLIVDAKSIAVGETYTLPGLIGQVLNAGSFISTLAGTATALTIRASGRVVS
jgi:hypothetical protein